LLKVHHDKPGLPLRCAKGEKSIWEAYGEGKDQEMGLTQGRIQTSDQNG
jgi:hypothetical protein